MNEHTMEGYRALVSTLNVFEELDPETVPDTKELLAAMRRLPEKLARVAVMVTGIDGFPVMSQSDTAARLGTDEESNDKTFYTALRRLRILIGTSA